MYLADTIGHLKLSAHLLSDLRGIHDLVPSSFRRYGFVPVGTILTYCASPIPIMNSSNTGAKLIVGKSILKTTPRCGAHSQTPFLARRAWYCTFFPIMFEAEASRRTAVFIDSSFSDEITVADIEQLPRGLILLSTMRWNVLCC